MSEIPNRVPAMRISKRLVTAASFLLLAVCFNCARRETGRAQDSDASKKMIVGSYSGEIPRNPGFLKLEFGENGKTLFLNIVTLHLPPTEIERLETTAKYADNGRICFDPQPRTIEPCLVSFTDDEVVVKTRPDGAEVKLKKIKK